MKKLLIAPLTFLSLSGWASEELFNHQPQKSLIDIPCQGSRILITPNIEKEQNNTVISFVSLWGTTPPFIIVDDAYQAIVSGYAGSSDKFFGRIHLKNPNPEYFTIDGCHVGWSEFK